MTLERLASLCASALLLGALAACSSGSSTTSPDGGVDTGTGPDTGLPPNLDGAADSDTGSPPSSDGGGDSSTADGAEGDGGDGGGCQLPPEGTAPTCFTAFPQIAPAVVSTSCMSGSPPQAQGGTVPDGIYDLLIRTEYSSTCPMAPTELATLVICAGQWDWVVIYDSDGGAGSGTTYEYNYAAALGATSVALTSQCQSDLGHTNETLGYTYTSGGQLVLISMTGVVSTYAKR
jgi:hypothetical protein